MNYLLHGFNRTIPWLVLALLLTAGASALAVRLWLEAR
jgi:HAMP domain-containing protein